MTDREKLIELLCNLPTPEFVIGARRAGKKLITAGFIADYLIANSVTVRKKGKWKLVEFQSSPFDTDQALVCSCCGFAHQYDAWFNRCPNCGAYMRAEEDEYETD